MSKARLPVALKTYLTKLLDIEDGLRNLSGSVDAFPDIDALIRHALAATQKRINQEPSANEIRGAWQRVKR